MDTNLTALVGKAVEQALAHHSDGINLNTVLIFVGGVAVAIITGIFGVKIARITSLVHESKTNSREAVDGIEHVTRLVNGQRDAMLKEVGLLKKEVAELGAASGLATSQSPANEALQQQLNVLKGEHEELKLSKQANDERAADLERSRKVDDARRAKLFKNATLLNELMLANQ